MCKPTLMKKRLVQLTVEEIKQMGVTTLLLDVDNTLSTHHSQTPLEGIPSWLEQMKDAGIQLFIVSNSNKKRVAPFAQLLDLPYFYLCKKPLPFAILRAIKHLKVPKRQVMLCGDQIFTDIIAGRFAGIKTLLLEPALVEDGWTFRLRRTLEKPLIRWYRRREKTR